MVPTAWPDSLAVSGHAVRLMTPQFVKPYLNSNKNDANDAETIRETVTRPNMRFVLRTRLSSGAYSTRIGCAAVCGVNPNLIFVWRKQHRGGRLLADNSGVMKLLPLG